MPKSLYKDQLIRTRAFLFERLNSHFCFSKICQIYIFGYIKVRHGLIHCNFNYLLSTYYMLGVMLGARDTAENKAESCPRGKAQEICKKTNKTSDDVERFRGEQNRVVTMTEETIEWGVGPGLPGELRHEEQEADSHVKIRGQSTHFPEKGEPG